jgi:His Kinase A (phospho-acceptor) domain
VVRQGARVSLILAFVFPAIVCAAVALAYYGYRYAVASSVRSKASLMEGNQQLAQLLSGKIQDRIDRVDGELFEEVEWDDPATEAPSSFSLPAGVESVVVLDDGLRIRSVVPVPDPARRRRELDRWASYVKGLEWKSLQPWTSSHAGNFRHLHQLFEGKSVLIAYVSKKTDTGHFYYVAAKLDIGLIAKDWIPDEMDEVTGGHRRVAILDEVARPLYGEPQPATQFQYESSFGKTLYAWRIQITPSDVAELRKQADKERLLGLALVPVSLVIIAVGLGVLWLSVRAERRGSQLRSDFIANVSHELKTPLAVIKSSVEALVDGAAEEPEARAEFLAQITRESDRLEALIQDLLSLARIESGHLGLEPQAIPLGTAITDCVERHQMRAEAKTLTMVEKPPKDAPANVTAWADTDALRQVMDNLVDNAIKYTPNGGRITVRWSATP